MAHLKFTTVEPFNQFKKTSLRSYGADTANTTS